MYYICECCHETFPKKNTEEEMITEYDLLFPEQRENKSLVCHACYVAIMTHYNHDKDEQGNFKPTKSSLH
jgi:hypothetical protein